MLSSGGNQGVLERSVIARASSSLTYDIPYNALVTNDGAWESNSDPNSWYEIILLNDSFVLEKYGITSNYKGNQDFPQSWILRGSENGRDWINLSYIESSGLITYKSTINYTVEKKLPFRFFQFTMLGENYAKNYHFCMSRIYFYGEQIEGCHFNQKQSHKNLNYSSHLNTLFVYITLILNI